MGLVVHCLGISCWFLLRFHFVQTDGSMVTAGMTAMANVFDSGCITIALAEASMTEFTATDKRKCAAREAALRKNVYPKFVKSGRMSEWDANRETAMMREIAADYAAQEAAAAKPATQLKEEAPMDP